MLIEISFVFLFFFLFQQLRRSRSFCFTGHRKQKATLEGSRPIAGGRFRWPVERQSHTQFLFFFIHAARKFSEKKQYEEEEEEEESNDYTTHSLSPIQHTPIL